MWDRWDKTCRWTRGRLPLLAGDELAGGDRRRVERHLIGCGHCRRELSAQRDALGLLRAVAATSPTRDDAPSLWPALARQIREERRVAPSRPLAWPWAWPTTGLALAAGLLVAVGLGGVAYHAGHLNSPAALFAHRALNRPVAKPAPPAPPAVAVEPPAEAVLVAEETDRDREEPAAAEADGTR